MASCHDADFFGGDDAANRIHSADRAGCIAQDPRDLTVLDDINPKRARRARIAPGHGIVTGGAPATLQCCTDNRITHRWIDIEDRAECFRFLGGQPFIVDAGKAVGVDMTFRDLDIVLVVRQHHHTARRIHDVVIERLR